MAFMRKVPVSVRVDGADVCQGRGVEHGVIAAFCAYFVFHLAYMKKMLTFLQRAVLNITEVGEKDLPVTVTWLINLIFHICLGRIYVPGIITLMKLIQHVGLIHEHKSNFNITCGLNDCINLLHYMSPTGVMFIVSTGNMCYLWTTVMTLI